MRFGQIRFDNKLTAAVFDGEMARPIPGYSVVELIRKAAAEASEFEELAREMATRHCETCAPAIPIGALEVWACGSTYQEIAAFQDKQRGGEGIYGHAYGQARPEIFFKGTARVCAGPGQPIGLRFDSKVTVPQPELAVVLGPRGRILGFTLGNDVSAWDIERENPLYLTQSKIFNGCCALGPVIVTPDELPPIEQLEMSCTVTRGGEEQFSGRVSLAGLNRSLEGMIEYLLRANPVPAGSVLLTGSGIIVPEEAALLPGDVVAIRIPEIGELTNPTVTVQ